MKTPEQRNRRLGTRFERCDGNWEFQSASALLLSVDFNPASDSSPRIATGHSSHLPIST